MLPVLWVHFLECENTACDLTIFRLILEFRAWLDGARIGLLLVAHIGQY